MIDSDSKARRRTLAVDRTFLDVFCVFDEGLDCSKTRCCCVYGLFGSISQKLIVQLLPQRSVIESRDSLGWGWNACRK